MEINELLELDIPGLSDLSDLSDGEEIPYEPLVNLEGIARDVYDPSLTWQENEGIPDPVPDPIPDTPVNSDNEDDNPRLRLAMPRRSIQRNRPTSRARRSANKIQKRGGGRRLRERRRAPDYDDRISEAGYREGTQEARISAAIARLLEQASSDHALPGANDVKAAVKGVQREFADKMTVREMIKVIDKLVDPKLAFAWNWLSAESRAELAREWLAE